MNYYSVNLNLTEIQRKSLISFHQERIQQLKSELNELEDLVRQLTMVEHTPIKQEPITDRDTARLGVYKDTWGWAIKVRYVLSKVGRCLTTREIIEELKKYEHFDKDPINSISGTISSKATKGIMFGKYKPYNTEYYFGLKEWSDDQNNVNPEYAAI